MKLSIIVPVINEATTLPDLLAQLLPLQHDGCEVLLVDGGSSDNSTGLAERAGLQLIRSQRGRALQMNAGAAQATGEVLLFLHADTRLPEGAPDLVTRALSGKAHCWGRFDVRIAGRHAMLRVIGTMMNLRSRWSGIATGDQAMFVSRAVFASVGGFPAQPVMEDIELSKRLCRISRPACIRSCVITSGRRWETHGVWRTMLLMWRLRWHYWRGVPAEQLAKAYR
ncbi:TIGR04283 family arsenosugar biosynthesis glycosyltransferase [Rhodoferax sp.]|uniref:TIGR04283 family arsenosugar biosynthesis glycosyltransferase n=1 Tax=Rhodoferax sp. TaxID=50421 RepID=UPI002609CEC4|nr:TIGR04283 family arsenosugar biosynthesis glycosyltransferase [Rhodoferax sp.]MDD2919501.1 TIGR04283 family arsenosugar biosynthesis glycosyltransferase [Rhodoferax sp.]